MYNFSEINEELLVDLDGKCERIEDCERAFRDAREKFDLLECINRWIFSSRTC